jgi:hypothetical protein
VEQADPQTEMVEVSDWNNAENRNDRHRFFARLQKSFPPIESIRRKKAAQQWVS